MVYRLGATGKRIPVIADAGNHREVLHVPSGRRVPRKQIVGRRDLDELDLAGPAGPKVVTLHFGDMPWTPTETVRLVETLEGAGYGVRVERARSNARKAA